MRPMTKPRAGILSGRFNFIRTRRGFFVELPWFFFRFYPPTLPRLNWFWKRGGFAQLPFRGERLTFVKWPK